MIKVHRITDRLSVSAQIAVEDICHLRQLGFSQIIINRPDDEAGRFPRHDEVTKAAQAADLTTIYLPVTLTGVTSCDGNTFREAVEKHSGRTLAYCKSGARSRSLWIASQPRDPKVSLTQWLRQMFVRF